MYGPDTMEDIAKDAIPADFYKADLLLQVKRGCKVMLTSNLNPSRGLCNGSCGKVYDVVLDENNEVEYILVQFEDFEGEGFIGIDNWCQSFAIKEYITLRKENKLVKRFKGPNSTLP